jgi:predicted metal-dependent phosphoesterase TrpH
MKFRAFSKGYRVGSPAAMTSQRKFETGRGVVSFSGTPGRIKVSANALVTMEAKIGDTVLIYGDEESTETNTRLAIALDPNGSKLTQVTAGGKVKDGAVLFHAVGWGLGIRYNAQDVEPFSYEQLLKQGYLKEVNKKNGKYLANKSVDYEIGERVDVPDEEGNIVGVAYYLINPVVKETSEREAFRKTPVPEFSVTEPQEKSLFDEL